MGNGNVAIITIKERQEIARQIIFVGFIERAHDAEIECDITTIACHLDITWVHVGMKEAIAEYLSKEYFHAIAREFGDIDTEFAQLVYLADGDAIHALHHHHLFATPIPVDFWYQQ